MVDHFAAVGGRRSWLRLVDLFKGGIVAAIAFDGVPIGISDGLPEPRRLCLGRCRVSGCPGLENALGAVEMALAPSDRDCFDSPACLPELVPKLVVSLTPEVERTSGGNARIDLGEDGPVPLDGDWHLDVEKPDASVGRTALHARSAGL